MILIPKGLSNDEARAIQAEQRLAGIPTCPLCKGAGKIFTGKTRQIAGREYTFFIYCSRCEGRGSAEMPESTLS